MNVKSVKLIREAAGTYTILVNDVPAATGLPLNEAVSLMENYLEAGNEKKEKCSQKR